MDSKTRPRPSLFRALGAEEPPECIDVEGVRYTRVDIFKHDSWAATARYTSGQRDLVCKFNRKQSVLGFPMGWLGRLLARREMAALHRLADLPGIPAPAGPVLVNGIAQDNAAAHDFIDGHPLGRNERVEDQFFPRLLQLLEQIHARGMAYVDLHKRENVVVGSDGLPYLIDFQVYFVPTLMGRRVPGLSILLKMWQQADRYHLAKHLEKLRPDQLVSVLGPQAGSRPAWISWHRRIAVPLRSLRRWFLGAIGVRDKTGRCTSEVFAEDAFRRESPSGDSSSAAKSSTHSGDRRAA